MKSISVPFRFTTDTKGVAVTSNLSDLLKQSILDILTTTPGERVMEGKHGANARGLLFEEPDPLVFAEFRMDAMNELNALLPFGKVLDLNVYMPNQSYAGDPTDSTIVISVKYVVPPFDVSVVTFNLNDNTITTVGG